MPKKIIKRAKPAEAPQDEQPPIPGVSEGESWAVTLHPGEDDEKAYFYPHMQAATLFAARHAPARVLLPDGTLWVEFKTSCPPWFSLDGKPPSFAKTDGSLGPRLQKEAAEKHEAALHGPVAKKPLKRIKKRPR